MEDEMEIRRYWKNGRIDKFTLDRLQNSLERPVSPPFEPKTYNHIKINGIEIYNYKGPDLPGEIFVYMDRLNIYVSNLARIKKTNDEIISQKEMRNDPEKKWEQTSLYVDIPNKFRGFIYKLVAEAFFDESKLEVHHISGNALDNRAENLIYVTKEQHSEIEPYGTLNKRIWQELKIFDWENCLLNFESGVSVVNNVAINISEENIFTDFCYRIFKFYNVEISYDYYLGGSKDNIKGSKTIKSGMGEFVCSGSNIDSINIIKIDT
jgi:hypothetical protein